MSNYYYKHREKRFVQIPDIDDLYNKVIDLEKTISNLKSQIVTLETKINNNKPFDMHTIWPHADGRYITRNEFAISKRDLNIKLKKYLPNWKNWSPEKSNLKEE